MDKLKPHKIWKRVFKTPRMGLTSINRLTYIIMVRGSLKKYLNNTMQMFLK